MNMPVPVPVPVPVACAGWFSSLHPLHLVPVPVACACWFTLLHPLHPCDRVAGAVPYTRCAVATLTRLCNCTCRYNGNTFARAGGIHIGPEVNWLEGDLGITDVLVENNLIVKLGVPAISVDNSTVKPGHVTLKNNTDAN